MFKLFLEQLLSDGFIEVYAGEKISAESWVGEFVADLFTSAGLFALKVPFFVSGDNFQAVAGGPDDADIGVGG